MKKILYIMLVAILLVSQRGRAQDEIIPRFTIKTNPLAAMGGPLWLTVVPLTGEYKVLFEAKTANKQSIEVGGSFLGPSVLLNLDRITSDEDSISGIRTRGFRAQLGYKFFLSRDEAAPEGFFVGPHVSYAAARLENKDNVENYIEASKFNASVLIGYQMITTGGFTLNIYTGLGFKHREYNIPEGEEGDGVWDLSDAGNANAPAVPFGFSFGYAF